MKKNIIAAFLFIASSALAQDVGVKIDKAHSAEDQDTTISISKGSRLIKKKYTISEGNDELTGDKTVVKKDAEMSWKKACDDWKKEFKSLNKDNQIISMSCGSMSCSKEGVESTCSSTSKYKVKVLAEE